MSEFDLVISFGVLSKSHSAFALLNLGDIVSVVLDSSQVVLCGASWCQRQWRQRTLLLRCMYVIDIYNGD